MIVNIGKDGDRYIIEEEANAKEMIKDLIIGFNLAIEDMCLSNSVKNNSKLGIEFGVDSSNDKYFAISAKVTEPMSYNKDKFTISPGIYLVHKEYYKDLDLRHYVAVMQTLILQRPSNFESSDHPVNVIINAADITESVIDYVKENRHGRI